MNDDLISRKAAIDALAKFVPYAICDASTESYTNGLTDAYNLICQLPPAQQEIIRCRDCKHYIPYDWMFGGLSRSSNINNYSPDDMVCLVNDDNYPPDGFCSKAERREDG